MTRYVTVKDAGTILRDLAHSNRPECVSLQAPPAAGRGHLLDDLASVLAGMGRPVARLSIPGEDLDAPAVALVQAGACNGVATLDICRDLTVPFDVKVDRMAAHLPEDAAVLVYAPSVGRSWGADPSADRVGGRISNLIDVLGQDRLTIVAGGKWLHVRGRAHELKIIKWAPDQPWIEQAFSGDMAAAVARLNPRQYMTASRLELRLATALVCLGTPSREVEGLLNLRSIESLVDLLWQEVSNTAPQLKEAWVRLSVARTQIPLDRQEQLLPALGPRDRNILTQGLTYVRDDAIVLHERLRRIAAAWLRDQTGRWATLHKRHADLWSSEMTSALLERRAWRALEAETHLVHHASEAGVSSADLEDHIHFQDQFCALGRALSKRLGRFQDAAACFRKAVALDPSDPYAHHYLAYNLERADGEPGEVSGAYRAAIDLDPANVWWHQRLVRWCIARGRPAEARDAWRRALDDTIEYRESGGGPALGYFENMHKMVLARSLTQDLELSKEIIADVPEEMFEQSIDLRRQRRILEVLDASETEGVVYPLHVLLDRPSTILWTAPLLLPAHVGQPPKERARWFAARVEALDGREVHFLAGTPNAEGKGKAPGMFRASLTRERFDAATKDDRAAGLEPGRYFEAGEYGAENELVIRVHAVTQTEWHKLEPVASE